MIRQYGTGGSKGQEVRRTSTSQNHPWNQLWSVLNVPMCGSVRLIVGRCGHSQRLYVCVLSVRGVELAVDRCVLCSGVLLMQDLVIIAMVALLSVEGTPTVIRMCRFLRGHNLEGLLRQSVLHCACLIKASCWVKELCAFMVCITRLAYGRLEYKLFCTCASPHTPLVLHTARVCAVHMEWIS